VRHRVFHSSIQPIAAPVDFENRKMLELLTLFLHTKRLLRFLLLATASHRKRGSLPFMRQRDAKFVPQVSFSSIWQLPVQTALNAQKSTLPMTIDFLFAADY